MHGLYGRQILFDYALYASAPFAHVAADSAEYSLVRVGFDEYFYVHNIAEIIVVKREYSVDYYHGFRLDFNSFIAARMNGKIVHGAIYRPAASQNVHLFKHKVEFERFGNVVIEFGAFFERNIVVREIIVIAGNQNRLIAEIIADTLCESRFARPAAAGNAYNE